MCNDNFVANFVPSLAVKIINIFCKVINTTRVSCLDLGYMLDWAG